MNRDLPILLCLTLFFRVLAAAQAGYRLTSRTFDYAVGFACVVYLTFLRPPLLLLCGLTLAVCLLIQKQVFRAAPDVFKPVKTALLVLLLVAAGGSALWAKDHLASLPLAGQAIQFTSLDNLNHRLESSEEASSVYMEGTRYSPVQDLLTTLPLATLYFMYSPLPWQVQTSKQALGLVDTMLLLVLTYYFWKGARLFYRHHRKFAIVLFAFLMVGFCTSSLLQSNVGTAMRHRSMFFFLMVPVAVQAFLGPRKHLEVVYSGLTCRQ